MTDSSPNQDAESTNGKFHWLTLGEPVGARPYFDRPIFETENFVVLPSVGSMVPGWMLVIPKFAITRIADISCEAQAEFEELLSRVRETVRRRFGESYIFEHGGLHGSPISCGVDQAHLHVVPLPFDFFQHATNIDAADWQKSGSLTMPYHLCGSDEYWFIASDRGSAYKAASGGESQWFRKLLAHKLEIPQLWDYKKHEFTTNIKETINQMNCHDRRRG